MTSDLQIAALLPAYNEAGRIGRVLSVISQVNRIDEILVIDDGSVDSTVNEVQQLAGSDQRIRLVSNKSNSGKGQAILNGLNQTKAGLILMLDADLIGLKPQHVVDLIRPVVDGEADMTVGLFEDGKWNTDFSHRIAPWLSGQRCMRRELLGSISPKAAAGYGLETALSIAARRQGWRCRAVGLQGMTHESSAFISRPWQLISGRILMYLQVARAWYYSRDLTNHK